MNKSLTLRTGLALATFVAGCTPRAEEYCDQACACRACNEMEHEECVIAVDEALDLADAYDCSAEADDLYDCALERGYCDQDGWHWINTCAPYSEMVDRCVSAHSARWGSVWWW